ncbi:MAG: helix-turn-helix domain-containing protein [Clostridia bacterium]|nr:helix-turn-helix domain-containing protein [Clostridia bacterium]
MNEPFLTVTEAAELLHISKSHAYKVIHRLNQELKAQGVLTISGRINRNYLLERTAAPKRKEAEDNGSV